MTVRDSTNERLVRLLALVPWVASHPDGVPLDEVCERFATGRTELARDLDTVWLVGHYPFTPDTYIEAWIVDDRVIIRFADAFKRPLRFTPGEALALTAAARGLLAIPAANPPVALLSAIEKLGKTLGGRGADRLDIDFGSARGDVFEPLASARDRKVQVEIDYVKPGGSPRTRRIEPASLFSWNGHWYVGGWCHDKDAHRLFRVDRIVEARITDQAFEHEEAEVQNEVVFDAELPEVEIDVDARSAWLFDTVPVLERTEGASTVRFRLAIGSNEWLAKTLVQLGPRARVVAGDRTASENAARELALKMLKNYR